MPGMNNPVAVALIGFGYWGPNLARNLVTSGVDVRMIFDVDERTRAAAHRICPGAHFAESLDEVLQDDLITAVCIATPASTHFDLATKCLNAGKHCLVEKPLAISSDSARSLIKLANEKDLLLMVDHTYLYHGGIRKIRELVESEYLGPIMYFDSVRINLGLFQSDVNVIWDLAVHDFSIMLYVLGRRPEAVSATSICHIEGHPASMAYVTCFFSDRLISHVHVNWLAPVKIRKMIVGGVNKMIIFDELAADEQVRIYDRGFDLVADDQDARHFQVSYRAGDMSAPQLDRTEPLSAVISDFIECIQNPDRTPVSYGAMGYDVIKIIEAAEDSHRLHGARVNINWNEH